MFLHIKMETGHASQCLRFCILIHFHFQKKPESKFNFHFQKKPESKFTTSLEWDP